MKRLMMIALAVLLLGCHERTPLERANPDVWAANVDEHDHEWHIAESKDEADRLMPQGWGVYSVHEPYRVMWRPRRAGS